MNETICADPSVTVVVTVVLKVQALCTRRECVRNAHSYLPPTHTHYLTDLKLWVGPSNLSTGSLQGLEPAWPQHPIPSVPGRQNKGSPGRPQALLYL